MKRTRKNNILYIEFEKGDWEGQWARRVMNITKTIPGWRYNPKDKQWSIPMSSEEEWKDKIDRESVEYWSKEEYDDWLEETFGS